MNDVIVVTGASAGLGRSIVCRFARDGSTIGLIARGRERLEQTLVEVESLGGRGLVLPLDLADAARTRCTTPLGMTSAASFS